MPVNDLKWVEDVSEFDESFIKSHNDESDEGYFFEIDIKYLENFHNLHNDLPFSPKIMKIEKNEKLVANLHEKIEHVIYIMN